MDDDWDLILKQLDKLDRYPPQLQIPLAISLAICISNTVVEELDVFEYPLDVRVQEHVEYFYEGEDGLDFVLKRTKKALSPLNIFETPTYRKTYTCSDVSKIIFMVNNTHIDILNCETEELCVFFKYDCKDIGSHLDTSLIVHLIRLLKSQFNIKNVNIIERTKPIHTNNMPNGLTEWENTLIHRRNVPEVHPNRLAIGIFTHGAFVEDTSDTISTVDVPVGVSIKKRNVGAAGCYTFSHDYVGWPAFNATADALKSLDTCITPEEYSVEASKRIEQHPEDVVLHNNKGTCALIEGASKYYLKYYVLNSENSCIIFVMIIDGKFKYINIGKCTREALIEFLQDESVSTIIEPIIETRDRENRIGINDLFFLIETLHRTVNITDVHIYDKTCNIVMTPDEPDQISKCGCKYFKHGIGWGGKRKRTKRKVKKRSRKTLKVRP